MGQYDEMFMSVYNEYYPFERYILRKPVKINYLFDDIMLTELFIPGTEIKTKDDGIDEDEVYIKVNCRGNEFRMSYFDFGDHIREGIRQAVHDDFGGVEWEQMYVEYDDSSDLKTVLEDQYKLISEKYGSCGVKANFKITSTLELLDK